MWSAFAPIDEPAHDREDDEDDEHRLHGHRRVQDELRRDRASGASPPEAGGSSRCSEHRGALYQNESANARAACFVSAAVKSLSFSSRESHGCAVLGAAVAVVACTTTGSSAASTVVTTYAPVTSIEVDANSLFARIGCGPNAGQAYKYVVVAYQAGPEGLAILGAARRRNERLLHGRACSENLSTAEPRRAELFLADRRRLRLARLTNALLAEGIDVDALGPADLEVAERDDRRRRSTLFGRRRASLSNIPNVESLASCDPLE